MRLLSNVVSHHNNEVELCSYLLLECRHFVLALRRFLFRDLASSD